MRALFVTLTVLAVACNNSGMVGPEGPAGATGPAGPRGETGATGAQGVVGPQGPQGDAGLDGINCWDLNADRECNIVEDSNLDGKCSALDCVSGIVGPQGLPGMQGVQGPPGQQGLQGTPGVQGAKGDKGDQGMKGDTGLTGPQGAPGPQGVKGDKGDKGDTGATGPAGPTSVGKCPPGMTTVDTGNSTICYGKGANGNFIDADKQCVDDFKASICTMAQWRWVFCYARADSPTPSWVNSIGGAQSLGAIRGCSGEDIFVAPFTTKLDGPCCLEWMNY